MKGNGYKKKDCKASDQQQSSIHVKCNEPANPEQSRRQWKRAVLLLLLLILLVPLIISINCANQHKEQDNPIMGPPKTSTIIKEADHRDNGSAVGPSHFGGQTVLPESTPTSNIPIHATLASETPIDKDIRETTRWWKDGPNPFFSRESLEKMAQFVRKDRDLVSLCSRYRSMSPRKVANSESATKCTDTPLNSARNVEMQSIEADVLNEIKEQEANLHCQIEATKPTIPERLEHIERHFKFSSFVEDPLECINSLESGHIFQITSIPRPILAYIARKRYQSTGVLGSCREQARRFWEELSNFDGRGNGYSQVDMRKSFEKWKNTIKETIETGGNKIDATKNTLVDGVAQEFLGPYLKAALFADRDDQQNKKSTGADATGSVSSSQLENSNAEHMYQYSNHNGSSVE